MTTSYIINLKSSENRRTYMEGVMAPLPFLRPVFIEAVNGRELSDCQISELFDQEEAYSHYGRKLTPAEIGCALSHRKCAKALLDSDEQSALILEDDLIWQTNNLADVFEDMKRVLDTETPMIILLSGDYWYYSLTPLNDNYRLAKVWDAVCAQAYMINRAGAQALLNITPWHLADDWREIKRYGSIKLRALHTHVADQNRAEIETVIGKFYGGVRRDNMSLIRKMDSYWRSFVDKMIVRMNKFESKEFRWR